MRHGLGLAHIKSSVPVSVAIPNYSQQQMISGMVWGYYLLLFLLLFPATDDIRHGMRLLSVAVAVSVAIPSNRWYTAWSEVTICCCFCCYSQQQIISGMVWGYHLLLFLLLFPATDDIRHGLGLLSVAVSVAVTQQHSHHYWGSRCQCWGLLPRCVGETDNVIRNSRGGVIEGPGANVEDFCHDVLGRQITSTETAGEVLLRVQVPMLRTVATMCWGDRLCQQKQQGRCYWGSRCLCWGLLPWCVG